MSLEPAAAAPALSCALEPVPAAGGSPRRIAGEEDPAMERLHG
jgi:hypothetical protein